MHIGSWNRLRRRSNLPIQVLTSFLLIAIFSLAAIAPATAREPDGARRDVAALLKSSKKLRIAVVGDSIAGDLARGMQKILHARDNLEVIKFTKAATGLMRDDVYDWPSALRGFLRKRKVDVIAVMIGGNDRQSIWLNGNRLTPGNQDWEAEYQRRLARFMDIVAKEKAKVYWIGLPPVRSGKMSRDYEGLNRIFRAEAKKHGFTYISTWEAFADGKGRYTSFGRDLDGTKRRLRKKDGMHFTIPGELRLAHTIARAIGRDLDEIEPSQ